MRVRKEANRPVRGRRARWWLLDAAGSLLLFYLATPVVRFEEPWSLVLLDGDGRLLGAAVAADGQWRLPPGGPLPEKFRRCLLQREDRRFYYHPGVDPLAVARALWQNLSRGEVVSGASTITMQVVRLRRPGRARTLSEKLLEAWLALRLELALSKEEILALWAAHAPFGGNVVGLEAAALRYFERPARDLSWAEAAMLAVLPHDPAEIHPGRNRERLRAKRDRLLDQLHGQGTIDEETWLLAKNEPLPSSPRPLPSLAPHLLNGFLSSRHSRHPQAAPVQTTLRLELQRQAAAVLERHRERLRSQGVHNAAALVLDVQTGEAVAYLGNLPGGGGEHGEQVDIVRAPRSTGSLLKPLLYAAMLQEGELLPGTLVADIPTHLGGFSPENFDRTFSGATPAAQAIARSLNVPAVRLLRDFGVDRFRRFLRRLGMTTLHRSANEYGLSLILGGAEGTLWELTTIFAGLARAASGHTDFFRSRVTKAAAEAPPAPAPWSPAAAYLALQATVEARRPGEHAAWRAFGSSRQVAWKTGTSFGHRDAWAIGVTPHYAVGVWVGNADGEGRPGLTGISCAAPIMFDIFELLPSEGWFSPPRDLVPVEVCEKSGMLAGPNCRQRTTVLAPASGTRSPVCPYCRLVHLDPQAELQVHAGCQDPSAMRHEPWFVLPPAMEAFYARRHSDYRPLPPYRPDCLLPEIDGRGGSISLLYPPRAGHIWVPRELDGQRGKTVFEAAHRQPHTRIFWHLDKQFLGVTQDIHQLALAPAPGEHRLVLVDEQGERLEREFVILGGE